MREIEMSFIKIVKAELTPYKFSRYPPNGKCFRLISAIKARKKRSSEWGSLTGAYRINR
jgi:hypothetical protein